MKKKADFFSEQTRVFHNHQWMLQTGEVDGPAPFTEYQPDKLKTPHGSPGCRAVIEFREWCDEWRLRTAVDGQNMKPPEQAGDRISELLSHRGARKIADSCEYMHQTQGCYKTFVTGTFTAEVREKIANGDTSIQKEVSRTLNSLQKMYQRGWTTQAGERVEGHSQGLPYCWVVEVPKNEQGEDNPHIHMLLGWQVAYKYFAEWSQRIEAIWGNGYFHLEKIKDSTCAGAYMAKAAGYLSKAQDNDTQGKVTGNRYGISAVARAPGWITYANTQLHIASQLIVDVYDHLTQKYGEKYRARKQLNQALAKIPKEKKALRQHIGKKLAGVRAELNALPIRCNKYQVICKGRGHAFRFLNWCINDEDKGTDWLPEKEPGMAWQPGRPPEAKDSLYFTLLHKKIARRKLWRRLRYPPDWLLWTDRQWHQIKKAYVVDAANDAGPAADNWLEYCRHCTDFSHPIGHCA
ncbi:MAG: hypothetical protein KTR20_14175 [Cellvibrionaceae bacterium]|nr:hypothetical protein [Cellvibrionaceae bacterium]